MALLKFLLSEGKALCCCRYHIPELKKKISALNFTDKPRQIYVIVIQIVGQVTENMMLSS